MNQELPDIQKFETQIFRKKNVLPRLLSFSLKLMGARHTGLVFGTDHSLSSFLPPGKWDRGVMHKFDGKGLYGLFLKMFGKPLVRFKKLSPIKLYRTNGFGDRIENEGVISYVLRNHQDFYEKGIKILIIDNQAHVGAEQGFDSRGKPDTGKIFNPKLGPGTGSGSGSVSRPDPRFSKASVISYDGSLFKTLPDIRVNRNIVRQFQSENFIAAYIPDYGAIVFNTVDEDLVAKANGCFSHEQTLTDRLDILISAIQKASLVYLGRARGKPAARIIWRKERKLRKMADTLREKETELEVQKKYLRAVGGVTARQLNMSPMSIPDGVYAFMDMVGSALIRNSVKPRDYFLILNLCHEIAAENAALFACRVDNIIGDSVFFQNISVFDDPEQKFPPGIGERVMLMTCLLSSVLNDIHLLKLGRHPMDRDKRVITLMKNHGLDLHFRAGLESGTALIGPLGSKKRKIVTALGRAVNMASRLESTGVKDGIHTSEKIIKILENALISKDTPMIQEFAREKINPDWVKAREYIPFFDFYKKQFKLCHDVVQKRKNVSYKEFSRDLTYLIRCIPTPHDAITCPGI